MKPTVITSGNAGDNPQVTSHNTHSQTTGPDPNGPQQGYHPSNRPFPSMHQQEFGFDDDDMFANTGLRSRLAGRMRDPFARFDAHFFPEFSQFGGRRRVNQPDGDEAFFGNIPSEFLSHIPEGFGFARRANGGVPQQQSPRVRTQSQGQEVPQFYQTYVHPATAEPAPRNMCDAAIQTEDLGRDQTDGQMKTDNNLNQHGLRNTVDLGVKTPAEGSNRGPRAHSAPPQDQGPSPATHSQGTQRNTPPPQKAQQRPTQAPPSSQQQYHKTYYPPHAQPHPQQQPSQPQTPGGTFIRTIPIFVEGRSEPIINHKDIPAQHQASAPAPPQPQAHPKQQHPQQSQTTAPPPQNQQQHRPTPLNTQQPTPQDSQVPPQTPHTMASIEKIQSIQRDVLELMTQVEKFSGTRADKEYAYLDEMLTRNLLKLDTIDTQGKESIRLARKEAIKCIQASINVLEAIAEGNAKTAQEPATETSAPETQSADKPAEEESQVSNPQVPIPLPPPESFATTADSNPATDEASQEKAATPPPKESSPSPAKQSAKKKILKKLKSVEKKDKNPSSEEVTKEEASAGEASGTQDAPTTKE